MYFGCISIMMEIHMKIKTPLTNIDKERIREMVETGQNIAPLLNERIIKGGVFEGAIIDGLLISGEDLRSTKFKNCKIRWTANKTDFRNCIIRDCVVRGEANYTDFRGCIMKGSDFTLLKTKYADFREIDPCGMKISLFTPNVFGIRVSKSMIDLLLKTMWKVEDDGFKLPENILRG